MKPVQPQALTSARILVVGDVMLDRYWYGAVDRIIDRREMKRALARLCAQLTRKPSPA